MITGSTVRTGTTLLLVTWVGLACQCHVHLHAGWLQVGQEPRWKVNG